MNLQRPFTLTQKLLPLLLKSPSPRIIHIGSISGIAVPGLETYAYSASKAGLHHLSQVLAVKLGQRGVRVNTIACGPFESKMMEETLKNVTPSPATSSTWPSLILMHLIPLRSYVGIFLLASDGY